MIAIAILGLGLVMVASLFPVGWVRARDLVDSTTTRSIANTAETALLQLTAVEGPTEACANTDPCFRYGTGSDFVGDLLLNDGVRNFRTLTGPPDTLVHALNLQNILANDDTNIIYEDPWLLEGLPNHSIAYPLLVRGYNATYDGTDGLGRSIMLRRWYGIPTVWFEQRAFPELPIEGRAYGGTTVETRVPNAGQPLGYWQSLLDTRRFAWGVLHRFATAVPLPQDTNGNGAIDLAEENAATSVSRTLTAYLFSLRRVEPTHRFAQQDRPGHPASAGGNVGIVNQPARAASLIQPLPATEDVLFPTPWLVPVWMIGGAGGVPGQMEIQVMGAEPATPVLHQMFPPGTIFVSYVNGITYKVTEREIFEPAVGTVRSRHTLQQGVLSGPNDDGFGLSQPILVWVYPPRVERQDGVDSFEGPTPVAGMEIHPLTIRP